MPQEGYLLAFILKTRWKSIASRAREFRGDNVAIILQGLRKLWHRIFVDILSLPHFRRVVMGVEGGCEPQDHGADRKVRDDWALCRDWTPS